MPGTESSSTRPRRATLPVPSQAVDTNDTERFDGAIRKCPGGTEMAEPRRARERMDRKRRAFLSLVKRRGGRVVKRRRPCRLDARCDPPACGPATSEPHQDIALRIATWNVDGFSEPTRFLEIASFLWRRKVDIAVLTESHLLGDDIFFGLGEGEGRIMRLQLDH